MQELTAHESSQQLAHKERNGGQTEKDPLFTPLGELCDAALDALRDNLNNLPRVYLKETYV